MKRLNLPTYSFNIKSEGERQLIFDPCRSKWVYLSPEEWVRQNLLKYLTEDMKYPAGLIATEMSIKINSLDRRCDIVVHNRQGIPVMIVECKAPEVKLSQETFDQANNYNWALGLNFIIVTNGMRHFCLEKEGDHFVFRDSFPDYDDLDFQS
jgi:hypothetical protein